MLISHVTSASPARAVGDATQGRQSFHDAMEKAASLRDAPAFAGLRAQHQALLQDALDLAPGFDVSAPLSAVQVVQRQMRQSAVALQYHCVLQAAANVTHSVKALTSLQ